MRSLRSRLTDANVHLVDLVGLVVLPVTENLASADLNIEKRYHWIVWLVMVSSAVIVVTANHRLRPTNRGGRLNVQRRRLQTLVSDLWISQYLDQVRRILPRVSLRLVESPQDVVARLPEDYSVEAVLRAAEPTEHQLTTPQTIGNLFGSFVRGATPPAKTFHESLLIIGEPGAGKTMLLLELLECLLRRAQEDPGFPVPVLFSLGAWRRGDRALRDWMCDQLVGVYNLPPKLSRYLIDENEVMPLLDGLDEVDEKLRGSCLNAINAFCQDYQGPIAVSVRSDDYRRLEAKLNLLTAVIVRPISRPQVRSLIARDPELLVVKNALHEDPPLWGLMTNPLMLRIAASAYLLLAPGALRTMSTVEDRRAALFDAYVAVKLRWRTRSSRYADQDCVRWLSWLARTMFTQSRPVLFVDRMQPEWLFSQRLAWLVRSAPAIGLAVIASVAVVAFSLAVGGAMPQSLVMGAIAAAVILLAGSSDEIKPAEWIGLSVRDLVLGVLGGGALLAVFVPLYFWGEGYLRSHSLPILKASRVPDLIVVSGFALFVFYLIIESSVSVGISDTHVRPGHGIRRSGLLGILCGVCIAIVAAGICGWSGTTGSLGTGLGPHLNTTLYGAFFGVAVGLPSGLLMGGKAWWQHHVLRFLLARRQLAPKEYIGFLDFSVERVFLHHLGGGYSFIHPLLQQHIAEAGTDPASPVFRYIAQISARNG